MKIKKKKRFSVGSFLINSPYFIWSALFIIIPLGIVLYFSFTNTEGRFTFENLGEIGASGVIIVRSLWYSALATIISLIVAYPFSYAICKLRPSSQKIANMFVTLPLWINLLVKTYCLSALLEKNGFINNALAAVGFGRLPLINNTGAVIFGMVYNYLPYMIIPVYNVMSKIDPSLLEAAEDLGCSPVSRIRRVVLPLTKPGIISGIIMVFVPSVSTFYISTTLGGGGNLMIGDKIEEYAINQHNLPVAAMLSTVLLAIILVSMLILNRFSKNEDGGGIMV